MGVQYLPCLWMVGRKGSRQRLDRCEAGVKREDTGCTIPSLPFFLLSFPSLPSFLGFGIFPSPIFPFYSCWSLYGCRQIGERKSRQHCGGVVFLRSSVPRISGSVSPACLLGNTLPIYGDVTCTVNKNGILYGLLISMTLVTCQVPQSQCLLLLCFVAQDKKASVIRGESPSFLSWGLSLPVLYSLLQFAFLN